MNAKTILSGRRSRRRLRDGRRPRPLPASNQTGEAYGYGYRVNDARSPYSDGARDVHRPRNPFVDGARVNDQRSPFSDGARAGKFDPYTDGTHTVAGRDRTGVSAEPGRSADSAVETA